MDGRLADWMLSLNVMILFSRMSPCYAIAANSVDVDAGDKFGRTPLMFCILVDRMECGESLLKAGASVNKKDDLGRTALHWAAQKVENSNFYDKALFFLFRCDSNDSLLCNRTSMIHLIGDCLLLLQYIVIHTVLSHV